MTDDAARSLARQTAIRERDAGLLEASLGKLPKPVARPAVCVLIGLPGGGKSYLARDIARRYPSAVLDSDALRQVFYPQPEHTQREHARLFPAIHVLMDRLLARNIAVIVDATNLKEANRKPYYAIAARHQAKVVLVRAWAPVAVVRKRLVARDGARDPLDRSTATREVYEKMRADVERITRSHISVDTSKDIRATVDRIVALLQS